MILTATAKEGVAHLHGGGFKEGFIPVFVQGIQVTSARNEIPLITKVIDSYSSTVINWAWNLAYGKILAGRNSLCHLNNYAHVKDRTRENAQAEPCYVGMEVKNSTKYSAGGVIPNEYKLACMQGEFITIAIPDSMGLVTVTPANMFGLKVSNDSSAIEGSISFLGTKTITVGTSNGNSINISINSSLMKRIY